MSYTRQYPGGVPALQMITPGNFEYWDISISTAIDGTGGGTYSGPIILTNTRLEGTSEIDITGFIDTTGDVTCANIYVSQDAFVSGNLEVQGNELIVFNDLSVGVSGFVPYLFTRRIIPPSGGTQSIDTSTGTVLALDFTQHRDWQITLTNGPDPSEPAILATVATLVDTHADSWREVPPKMKFTITFRAGSGQDGGIGIDPDAGVFPASFHGISASDLVGPRSGGLGVSGGEFDWMRLELENIGTTGAPVYACKMTMGSG